MTNKKKLQVFISSTYTDLREERQAAVEAVLSAGHIPAGMELFAAGDESQMNVIKRWIDESDVYMLILGGRYGSIEPKSQKSYTHLEYEYALEKSKPLFAIVINEKHLEKKIKKYGSAVIETAYPDKLKLFRELVCSKMVRFWSDSKDIKLSILETMSDFSKRDELTGWLQGNELPEIINQIEVLTNENIQLKRKNVEHANDEIIKRLSIELLDKDTVARALRMAAVYAAIASFENSVRRLVSTVLQEQIGADWWQSSVPTRVRVLAEARLSEEAKIRWHTPRGDQPLNYTNFNDLMAIINQNWDKFEPFIRSLEWARQLMTNVERSRNVIMHSGEIELEDIERVGVLIRDWVKQVDI